MAKTPFDFRCAAAACACACFSGCFLLPIPDVRTPADRARELESRCTRFSEEASSRMLAPSLVEAVEPAYSYVSSGPVDRQARLRGARFHLRPVGDLSRELLQRNLECHQARVVLGTTPEFQSDPYVLPGRWLDIDADSDGDGFVVAVKADALSDARDVLARARRFAALGR
jgi:hypothetical protein